MASKGMSVEFEQDKSNPTWISLSIKSQGKIYKIDISSVFPPFNNLINFLNDIQKKKLSNLKIDEEGKIVEFIAKNLSKDSSYFHFVLRDALGNKEVYIEENYRRREFVKEFVAKLKDFLDNKFDEKGWMKIPTEKIPYDKVNQLIKTVGKGT